VIRKWALILLWIPAASWSQTVIKPAEKISHTRCQIVRAYFLKLSPQTICDRFYGGYQCKGVSMPESLCFSGKGSYCKNVKTEAEGLCVLLGGRLCNTAHNLAQGICLGLNDTGYCNQLIDSKNSEWIDKLKGLCL